MWKIIKPILVILCSLILGPALGCLLGGFWYSGANTFWQPIDYFPYPVQELIGVKPFGREFWVETTDKDVYRIEYPCPEKQTCWSKTNEVPIDFSDGAYVDYTISDKSCENSSFVYPLFHKIDMCITSATHAPDATYTVSLAISNNENLWIWDQPWESPYTVLANIALLMIVGAFLGLFIGTVLAIKLK